MKDPQNFEVFGLKSTVKGETWSGKTGRARQGSSKKIKVDAHGIREVKRPFDANCGNCFTRMTTGTWRCPTHGVDVDVMHICDCYKPGLM